uniref:hypothetical protein n=1 Tax=Pseudomonas aeruginosa TaxID=287 RepID=UPI0015BEB088|nr:hypothetical protein [Pseudomonas aeruginosa]
MFTKQAQKPIHAFNFRDIHNLGAKRLLAPSDENSESKGHRQRHTVEERASMR